MLTASIWIKWKVLYKIDSMGLQPKQIHTRRQTEQRESSLEKTPEHTNSVLLINLPNSSNFGRRIHFLRYQTHQINGSQSYSRQPSGEDFLRLISSPFLTLTTNSTMRCRDIDCSCGHYTKTKFRSSIMWMTSASL